MGYTYPKFPVFVVQRPVLVAVSILVTGLGGGVVSALLFPGYNLFERFGAVTVGLALFAFGALASELLVRAQGTFLMQNDGEPGGPFKFGVTRRALTVQTVVGLLGTLQWGFGSLVFAR